MQKKHRKTLLLAVKLTVAAGLLVLVFGRVHWNDYVKAAADKRTYAVLKSFPASGPAERVLVARGWWSEQQWRPVGDFETVSPPSSDIMRPGFATTLMSIDRLLLAVAALGFLLSLLSIVVRWWYLLRVIDVRISLWEAGRLTFLGQFFNAVVPGTVGGDLVKAYYVAKHTPHKAGVLVSVFVDRVMGLATMGVVSAAVLVIVVWRGLVSYEHARIPAITIVVVLCLVGGAGAFVLSSRLRRALHLQRLYQRLAITHHISAAGQAARSYRHSVGKLGVAVLVTLAAQLFFFGAIALLGVALGRHQPLAPWYEFFVYVPLIYIIGAVPITPGGVGVVEGAYLTFFAASPVSQVLALALLARLFPIFWSLPGLIVAITGPRLPKAEEIEAELVGDDAPAEPENAPAAANSPSDTT